MPHSNLPPMPRLIVEPAVRRALEEDLGRAGDITTDYVVPEDVRAQARIAARKPGVVAGLDAARSAFRLVDPDLMIGIERRDGDQLEPGDTICHLDGKARSILTGERVALNFLGHMSGIASEAAKMSALIAHTKARVTCTRKTTPGLRAFEKHAVRCGGGSNHRFGLDDGLLIKDNHIAVAGGVTAAIQAAKAQAGHMVKIECEVDTLDQLREALDAGAEAILLDNMAPATLAEAVAINDGRAVLEASGGITAETIVGVAESGVDLISVGWLTHSAPSLDLGLDIDFGD
ncbi:carboxylating nicotinate-nucleotide diphosphorylase [Pyruvatibacter mobilis]|uniref:carboxylating nicotinate-nucleotide diphosphorylase n=1 Tax=Pyruvatibacter mobilis TaxID=1712261 RepID=UPI003C7D5716